MSSTRLSEVKMPEFEVGSRYVKLTRWLKTVGEPVCAGEPLAEVDTGGSLGEITADETGTLVEIQVEGGDLALKGSVLGKIALASPVESAPPKASSGTPSPTTEPGDATPWPGALRAPVAPPTSSRNPIGSADAPSPVPPLPCPQASTPGSGIVQAPLQSLGWARFFLVSAIGLMVLAFLEVVTFRSAGSMRLTQALRAANRQAADGKSSAEERAHWADRAAELARQKAWMEEKEHAKEDKGDARMIQFSILPIAMSLWALSRRLRAPGALEAIEKDHRAPAIYLRSFNVDGRKLYGRQKTEEEVLVKALRKIGPVLAIGRPGEQMPELGAARLYVSDAEWQATALEMMQSAQITVLRVGETEGLMWEVARLRQNLSGDRVVFYAPDPKEYVRFRANVNEKLDGRLPESLSQRQFLGFTPDWQPRFFTKVSRFAPSEIKAIVASFRAHAGGMTGFTRLHETLRRLSAGMKRHPGFQPEVFAYLLAALWAAMVVLLPVRWLMQLTSLWSEDFAGGVASLVEIAVVGVLALSVAFWVYLRSPEARRGYSLALCLLLGLDGVSLPWRGERAATAPADAAAPAESPAEASKEQRTAPTAVRRIKAATPTDFDRLAKLTQAWREKLPSLQQSGPEVQRRETAAFAASLERFANTAEPEAAESARLLALEATEQLRLAAALTAANKRFVEAGGTEAATLPDRAEITRRLNLLQEYDDATLAYQRFYETQVERSRASLEAKRRSGPAGIRIDVLNQPEEQQVASYQNVVERMGAEHRYCEACRGLLELLRANFGRWKVTSGKLSIFDNAAVDRYNDLIEAQQAAAR